MGNGSRITLNGPLTSPPPPPTPCFHPIPPKIDIFHLLIYGLSFIELLIAARTPYPLHFATVDMFEAGFTDTWT